MLSVFPIISLIISQVLLFSISFPIFIPIGFIIGILLYFVQSKFISLSKYSISKEIESFGPLLTQLNETLNGLKTLNVLDKFQFLSMEYSMLLNASFKWNLIRYHLIRWFVFNLSIVMLTLRVSLVVAIIFFSFKKNSDRANLFGFFFTFIELVIFLK